MSKIEISVIIPAYNAEGFIERAINSVLEQKLGNGEVEIVVVENGSTDRTTEVVEALSRKIPCVKLLHSVKGVSNARNKGIKEAQGKWLMFLDADDVLVDGVNADELASMDADGTEIGFYGHSNVGGDRPVCDNGIEEVFADRDIEKCKVKVLKNPTRYMLSIAKIYKTEFLVKNQLEFSSEIRLSEDSEFVFRCLKKTQRVCFKNKILYKVIPNSASATRTCDGKKLFDYIYALNKTAERIEDESLDVKKAFAFYVLMNMNVAMVREIFSLNNRNPFSKKYTTMCETIKNPIFREAIQLVKIKDCTSVRMASILCLKLKCKPLAAMVFTARALQNHIREK